MDQFLSTVARPVFLAWEKLRLVYIAILTIVTLFLTGKLILSDPHVLFTVITGALGANILYFAGPITETYIRWLGYNKNWPRWVLFVLGTLLSLLLVLLELVSLLFPTQN